MARKIISAFWDRITRNNINDNFKELYNDVGDISGKITDEVYEEIKNNVNLNWREPVATEVDLPTDAETGDTRMTTADGKVYRYDGSEWIEIQQFNPDAIVAVEERLQTQIDNLPTKEEVGDLANEAEANSKDYTDELDTRVFGEASEVVRVVESGSNQYGSYIRYSDGRQECWDMTIPIKADEVSGNVYVGSEWVTFPKTFDSTKSIHCSSRVSSIGRWSNTYTPSGNGVTAYQYSSVKAVNSYATYVYAIGWWK